MARAVFDVVLPETTWVGRVSRQFPTVEFRLLTGVPVEDCAIELGEFLLRRTDRRGTDDGPGPTEVGAIATAIMDDPAVFDFELLHT